MAQPTYRDPTTVLRDQADWTGWLAQLQARCLSRNIWDKINPKTTTPLLSKPLSPRAPTRLAEWVYSNVLRGYPPKPYQ
ncbi:uncharacterized protein M421DRAFT_424881, partial [Didymella exigua CBS 183.55]